MTAQLLILSPASLVQTNMKIKIAERGLLLKRKISVSALFCKGDKSEKRGAYMAEASAEARI